MSELEGSLESFEDLETLKTRIRNITAEISELRVQREKILEPNDELRRKKADLLREKEQVEYRLKQLTSLEERQRRHIQQVDKVKAKRVCDE